MQLSMKSELVGHQVFMFVNSIFRKEPDTQAMAGTAMMQINEDKVEVKEVSREFLDAREEYLNYHHSHKGLVAIRVRKDQYQLNVEPEKMRIFSNVLTSFNYAPAVRNNNIRNEEEIKT